MSYAEDIEIFNNLRRYLQSTKSEPNRRYFEFLKSNSQGFREFIQDMTIDNDAVTIYDFANHLSYLIGTGKPDSRLRFLLSRDEKWFRQRWNEYV